MGYPKLDPNINIPDPSDSALKQAVQMRRLQDKLTPDENKTDKLKKACQDFEAIFINNIWKQMRASVPKDGLLHGKEEEMYLSMFDWEISRKMSSAGGIGLGDMLFEQLSRTLRKAGSETGGAPLPLKGVPLNRGLEAANPAPASNPVPERKEREVMNEVDRLAREIENRPEGGAWQPNRRPTAVPSGYRDEDQAMPRLEWPLDGSAGQRMILDPSGEFQGVSLSVDDGAGVRAAMDGRVSFAGVRDGLNTIVLDHQGGLQSVYTGDAVILVADGDFVRAGRKIAEFDDKERPNMPELRFELLENGRNVDPEELIQKMQVPKITGKTV